MTTLDQLCASLPNGFHDAEMLKTSIDYTKQEARLVLDVWVGDMQSVDREAYRLAEVTLTGLYYWVVEPPHPDYPFHGDSGGSGETINIRSMNDFKSPDDLKLPSVPVGIFANYIFVSDWNSYIFVAAKDTSLVWLGDKTVRNYV